EVLDLEEAKIGQAKEIANLKKRVKKLEKRRKSRPAGLRRLKKVGLNRRVESSKEKDSLGAQEDASKQRRNIQDIDQNAKIVIVYVREKIVEKEVSTADPVTTAGEVVTVANVEVSAALTTVTTANLEAKEQEAARLKRAQQDEKANILWDNIQAMMDADRLLAERLQAREREEFLELKEKSSDEIKKLFDKEMKRVNTFVAMDSKAQESCTKRTAEQLESDISKKQELDENVEAEVDDSTELKRCKEIVPDDGDDVIVKATPLQMFKNLNREDLEVLWDIVKNRFKKEKLVDDMDSLLFHTLKTMFEHNVEDTVRRYQQGLVVVKNWKLYDSYGVYCITPQSMVYYLLVEKMYPLTKNTLHQLWNDVRLQVDYECEMAYELLRLI
nr:hypothetical protein [Tanacetum cinerariifolium]